MNKGLKEAHNLINGSVSNINYHLNISNTNNNIIIEIPLLNTLNNLIEIYLIYNHQSNTISDFGNFKLNYYKKLAGDYYVPKYINNDDRNISMISATNTYNQDYYEIYYVDDNDGNYEMTGAQITKFDNTIYELTLGRDYPDSITTINNRIIYFNYTNNKLTSINDQNNDRIEFTYTNNLITSINYKYFNTLLKSINITYDNNKIINISYITYQLEYGIDDEEIDEPYETNHISITYSNNYNEYNIYGINNQFIDKFKYTYNTYITKIEDNLNIINQFEYYNDYTKVYDKYNNVKKYVFYDNKLLNYIIDDETNIDYYEYDIYEKITYKIEGINLIEDENQSLIPPNIGISYPIFNPNKTYTIICMASGNNSIIIAQTIYNFKDIFIKSFENINSMIEIYATFNFTYLLVLEDKYYNKYTYNYKTYVITDMSPNKTINYIYNNSCLITNESWNENGITRTNTYQYDINNNLLTETLYDGTITTYEYNSNKDISTKTSNGHRVTYNYTNRLIYSIKYDTYYVIYLRDEKYRIYRETISIVDNDDHTLYQYPSNEYSYDNYNRINYKMKNSLSTTQVISKIFNNELMTRTELVSVNDNTNITYKFTYDNNNRLIRFKDFNDNSILRFTYNNNDDISIYDMYNNIYNYNYEDGLIESITKSNNDYLEFIYDNKKRIKQIIDHQINNTKTITYDINDNIIKRVDNSLNIITINTNYNKDELKTKSIKKDAYIINYAYNNDIANNKIEIINPDINYLFDFIIFNHNYVSFNGIKPEYFTIPQYLDINGITYINATNGIKYKINIEYSDTKIFMKCYLTDTSSGDIFRIVNNQRIASLTILNNQYYISIHDSNGTHGINTYITKTTGIHSIYLCITEEYDDTYDFYYENYQFIIDDNEFNYESNDVIPFSQYYIDLYQYIEYFGYGSNSQTHTYNMLKNYKYTKNTINYYLDGRIQNESLKYNNNLIFTKNYTYNNDKLLTSITYDYNSKQTYATYANSNHITNLTTHFYYNDISITHSCSYQYDNLFRLISDGINTYEYYNSGDIKKYNNKLYEYDNLRRLIKIDNNTITYTNTYFISSYLNNTYSYTDNKLTTYSNGTLTATYTYNAYGLRVRKTIGNEITEYYYDENDNLVIEIKGYERINYIYNNEEVIGFIYNNERYYYLKDISGRIISIYDEYGLIESWYTYNGYGEITAIYGNQTIGNINHIRYKSYYYDDESNMYYLKSRYYNPSIGRFITPDNIKYINTEEFDKYNLYAYCNNNPVMYSDGDGHLALLTLLIGAAIGAAVSATASVFSQAAVGGWENVNGWQVLLDGVIGGISGALGASGITPIISMISGGLLGVSGSVGGDLISNGGDWSKVNIGKAIFMGTIGAALGKFTGAGSQNTSYLVADINAGKTWGSKAFLAVAESFGKQQTNRTLQQVMYMSLDKAITLHTAQAFTKVSLAVAASTFLGDVL